MVIISFKPSLNQNSVKILKNKSYEEEYSRTHVDNLIEYGKLIKEKRAQERNMKLNEEISAYSFKP